MEYILFFFNSLLLKKCTYRMIPVIRKANLQKERFFYVLKNSKHSMWIATCEIFDIFTYCEKTKMLVGENPQTPNFYQKGVITNGKKNSQQTNPFACF